MEERRELLELIVEEDHRLQLMSYEDGDGKAFVEGARALGLEGVVAKRKGSKYVPGKRSPDWRKIKLISTQDCVILGWTPGQGGRAGSFGALLVGAIDGGTLRWVGQVGTGFTQKMLEQLMEQLAPLVRDDPPIDDPALRKLKGATFVEPELVCEVEYLEIHEVHGEDARSVVPRPSTRQDAGRVRARAPRLRQGAPEEGEVVAMRQPIRTVRSPLARAAPERPAPPSPCRSAPDRGERRPSSGRTGDRTRGLRRTAPGTRDIG